MASLPMMKLSATSLAWTAAVLSLVAGKEAVVTLVPAAIGFKAENTGFVYGASPLLVANDKGAEDGGFRTFTISNGSTFEQKSHPKTGRSKIVVPIFGIGGRDLIVNVPSPDSLIRVYDATTGGAVESNDKEQLGDWSTACAWRSPVSGESYMFLFGKKMVVQFLIRGTSKRVEVLEVHTFPIPIEGESCTVISTDQVFFSAEDQPLYSFQASESIQAPEINTVKKDINVKGLATYHSTSGDYLFVVHKKAIDVYDSEMKQKGSMALSGIPKLSVKGGLSVLQSSVQGYPSGVFAFGFEGEDDDGIAVGSLDGALTPLGIDTNTKYRPDSKPCERCTSPISDKCSKNGFLSGKDCSCFAGFTGSDCSKTACNKDCSGHGKCDGPNVCKCEDGWTGPDCSFVAVEAKYETDANGGDGDDPAIWIHPTRPEQSKIFTTTKSNEGEGFGVFDLKGKLLQQLKASEPNNVDVIYNFTIGGRKVDLAYAACRGDSTLCLVQVNSTGYLSDIPGSTQSLPTDYEPYGSCTYRSQTSGKQYLFVNNKEAQYLQYELTATANGTLQTTLVRQFQCGSGGQVEGCVADEGAGYIFIGEEPRGIWRYAAEPTGSNTGVQIAAVGDTSGLHADVEGITLVPAQSGPEGYIIVSSQAISAYLIYERAPPHKYVETFTIVENKKKGIDHVSNTDGCTAVGNALNKDFPGGLFVTHDDANELAGGGTAKEASFKLVSLVDVLGKERVSKLGY
ncbi:phytase [Pyrenophora seminiperda CCB06]|uniref:Phytase n=1 Tax=Pyrenophora seminiperda CCB06 TaxID=1302712 RepID=A0A3M7M190_9PLEO|nr:phytase [Pyrenophora seminiperda CCB06]